MFKQRPLAFVEPEEVEAVWERLPEQARAEVTQHYARLTVIVNVPVASTMSSCG